MCCCEKPTVNGELGYRWQPNDNPMVREVNPPAITADETILYDEPGRCGGVDCHSHHFRLVKDRYHYLLLVRHGGDDERISLSVVFKLFDFSTLDSTARYWMFYTIYDAHKDAANNARSACASEWHKAAAEKRIRTRKQPNQDRVKVWVENADVDARRKGLLPI
jgi:hypothetical protein